MTNPLRVIDAARQVADQVNLLLDKSRPRLFHEDQLRESTGSITANIREGFGRRKGPERNQFFRYALASDEETDERLRANYVRSRITRQTYWPLHQRLVVIRKMLEKLMR